MKILGICASYGLHVCLIDDEKVLFNYSREEELKSDNLLSIIDEALVKLSLTFSDIDVVATSVGPGSFTGSRVAISLVKGLVAGQNKKLISFETFDAFGNENVVLSGFGKFVYIRDGENRACVELDSIKNFDGVTDNENIAKTLKIKKVKFDMTSVILNKARCGEFVKIEELSPVYLRASQAEIERSKKNDRR